MRKQLELVSKEALSESDTTESEILSKLKDKFRKTQSRSDKLTVLTVFPTSWTLAKIQQEFEVNDYMARQAKALVNEKGVLSSANCRGGKALSNDVIDAVTLFYTSDAISRIMPGRKDYVSVKKVDSRVHEQTHLVLCNLKETYQPFKEKLPQMKIGFSKFAELHPKECVLAGASGTHSVCVCTVYQNVKLMMTDSRIADITADDENQPLAHYRHCLSALQCNPAQEKCFIDQFH